MANFNLLSWRETFWQKKRLKFCFQLFVSFLFALYLTFLLNAPQKQAPKLKTKNNYRRAKTVRILSYLSQHKGNLHFEKIKFVNNTWEILLIAEQEDEYVGWLQYLKQNPFSCKTEGNKMGFEDEYLKIKIFLYC